MPPNPGVASALGALLTTPRVDAQRSYVRRGEEVRVEELNGVLADLQRGARADLAAEGHAETPDVRTTVSMRNLGQSHELDVSVTDGRLADDGLATLVERYHQCHERRQVRVIALWPPA